MLYLGFLIIVTLGGVLAAKKILNSGVSIKEARLKRFEFEYSQLSDENLKLVTENQGLDSEVNETISLYNLTREICQTLDADKILAIFKGRIKDYLGAGDCIFLGKDEDVSAYKGSIVFPLVIQQEILGSLVAQGIPDKERGRFQILAQQFIIGFKRALLYKKMQELSITDSLTRLFSRRHFLERFGEELRRSKKFRYSFSFVMADIDRFKNFNDKYGHLVGDAILREVSKALKDTLRQIDFVGRYGGEELAIVLVETDKQQALFAAERLRQAIESRVIRAYDEELKVTISLGVATFPEDGDSLERLIEGADKALYMAKSAGRNKVKYLS